MLGELEEGSSLVAEDSDGEFTVPFLDPEFVEDLVGKSFSLKFLFAGRSFGSGDALFFFEFFLFGFVFLGGDFDFFFLFGFDGSDVGFVELDFTDTDKVENQTVGFEGLFEGGENIILDLEGTFTGIDSFGAIVSGNIADPNSRFGLDDFFDEVIFSADVLDNPTGLSGIDGKADGVGDVDGLAVLGVGINGVVFVVGIGLGAFGVGSGFVGDFFGG